MKHGIALAVLAGSTALAGLPAHAGVPDFVTYSGRLTDGTGWGQSDVLEMTFRLYGSATEPDLLFEQSFPDPDAPPGTPGVSVEDGYFSVMLGDGVNPADGTDLNVSDVFGAHDQTWITVCVGAACGPADDLLPRQQVGSVPYAMKSEDCWQLGGFGGDHYAAQEELEAVQAELSEAKQGMVPKGSITMWSGSVAGVPQGWSLCDGSNGTPDLRGRFVIGGGGSYAIGDTGGANSVTLEISQMPSHTHAQNPHYHLGQGAVYFNDVPGGALGFFVGARLTLT